MANLYRAFRDLMPEAPLLVGVVTAVETGGCVIELPDGSAVFARGEASMGQPVFVRDGVIQGNAPMLPVIEIEI